MNSSSVPRICKACSCNYEIDESTGAKLDSPDIGRSDHHHYCPACWLVFGSEIQDDLFQESAPLRQAREIERTKSKSSGFRHLHSRCATDSPPVENGKALKPGVYLWLCCEGWMRFGPYGWLRFDDRKMVILDQDGTEVARKENDCWIVREGRGAGMRFSDPTITTTPVHPHQNSGEHPKAD